MHHHTSLSADEQLNNLIEFRQGAYRCLSKARDALFELGDALLTTPSMPSLAHLSLSPLFRRRWPSVYEALQDATPYPDREALLSLYAGHVRSSLYPTLSTPHVLLAGDNSAWPRPLARTLSERTYLYQHQPIPGLGIGRGVRPVTAGHNYCTLAWIPQEQGSWALPLLHERVAPHESALENAAMQLKRVRESLPKEAHVIAMYDSQYGCAPFVKAACSIECDKLLRLRPNLRLFEAPPPPSARAYKYKGTGPHPKHGAPFKLKDPSTWGVADETVWTDDAELGWVSVQVWHFLHFRTSPVEQMSVVRIHRPRARGNRRDPKEQWLAWVGYQGRRPPPIEEWWRLYGRRFALDHWYRFAKGRLHWTTPHLGTPKQGEVWSELMPLVTWQLWLGRGVVSDCPLPWQKAQPMSSMTPGRVAAGMWGVISTIGTPTCAPKPRGYSPGWPTGRPRKPKERAPVLKKPKRAA